MGLNEAAVYLAVSVAAFGTGYLAKDHALFAVSQAGMFNNLNDGMAWGIFPLYFALHGLSISDIGILTAIYPAV